MRIYLLGNDLILLQQDEIVKTRYQAMNALNTGWLSICKLKDPEGHSVSISSRLYQAS